MARHRMARRRLRAGPVVLAMVLVTALVAGTGYITFDDRPAPAAADPLPDPVATDVPVTEPTIAPGFTVVPEDHSPVPADSGTGRRAVFSQAEQRVWLVDAAGEVQRTYPVSGSVYDNLFPGTYQVFSKSRHATAFDYSGTMEYFVRFTYGTGGSAIGFHDIPRSGDGLAQTVAELGTPQSHGCIRQEREDAIAMWEFTDIGTTVVVV